MGMCQRHGQRIGGIGGKFLGFAEGQQHTHHVGHLGFFGVTFANQALLHQAGGIFVHGQPGLGGHQQRNGAGLRQLQAALHVFIHINFFHSCTFGAVGGNHGG